MNEILSILMNNYIFDIGLVKDGNFIYFEKVKSEKLSIKVKITKNELPNLIRKIENKKILHIVIEFNEYFNVYKITENNFLVIEFVVKSHIQLPRVILKDFMSAGGKLYYLDPITKIIKSGSVSTFNRKLGYYDLRFEHYLSDEYEAITGKVKLKLQEFVDYNLENIDLTKYSRKIKELFSIAVYRNPNFVKQINEQSVSSELIYNGYRTEDIVQIMKESGKFDFFSKFKVLVCINKTKIGFVTCKANFSEIRIDGGNISYIMPLSPDKAVMLVGNDYYTHSIINYGQGCYMIIDDEEKVKSINKYIYKFASDLSDESIVGIESDLIILQNALKDN